MYERPPKPEWPVNALPKHWVEALFSKMSAFYGDRFTSAWRGTKVDEVQKAWGIELFKLSREQLKAGSDALTAFSKPPTLPEFVNHCRQVRAEQAAGMAFRIENLPPATPEEAEKNLRAIRVASNSLKGREPTAEWAYKFVIRARSKGAPSSFEAMRCATDAITSRAGQWVIDRCVDPELRIEYSAIRDAVIADYRSRGVRLWETP